MSGDERAADHLEEQLGRLELDGPEHEELQPAAAAQHESTPPPPGHQRGQRSFRRRGRGGHRGRGGGRPHTDDQQYAPADQQQGPAERGAARGHRRFYRGGGAAAAHRPRTKSERSSLLDGMREPLPQSDQALFDGVEDFWDVVVAGYGPEMTEDDLWEVFGQHDVAEIIQFHTHDLRPYCHIYTTTQRMTQELLKCDRDLFRGHQLHVALSEDLIGRSISQTLRKQASKANRRPQPRTADDAEGTFEPPVSAPGPTAAAATAAPAASAPAEDDD
ncbi:Hypothetical predicted protein [Cloeon dipterum]|uniref:Uncharacterized protein n=1 Tax=Cloeon dipterum TaxID=197152 RepID=A0A8S1DBJ5_9INSE|nr:Hypothetical predicted protein [Cloeon dipterum]